MGKPILCLDFDGVIHSYTSGWQGADVVGDGPVSGAVEFIIRALDHFDVCVFSSRSGQIGGIEAMQGALLEWTPPLHKSRIVDVRFPTEKPSAMVTIDDRAITFEGKWPTMEFLKSFKPWNKRSR